MIKNLPASVVDGRTQVQSLGWEDSPGEGLATHSSILVCRFPRTEEPGRLQSIEFAELDMTEATEHARKAQRES